MAIQITKCGKCNNVMEVESNVSPINVLGFPLAKCHHCDSMNKTGYKTYSMMNPFQKVWTWVHPVIQALLYSIIGALVLFYLDDEFLGGIISTGPRNIPTNHYLISALIITVIKIQRRSNLIKEIEREYQKLSPSRVS